MKVILQQDVKGQGKKGDRERGNDYGSCSHKAGGTRKSQRFA